MAAAPRLEAHEKRLNPRAIMVDPLTPVVGAEIGGIDLSKPILAEQLRELREAFNAWHSDVTCDAEPRTRQRARGGYPGATRAPSNRLSAGEPRATGRQ